jgi:hypothetical protein
MNKTITWIKNRKLAADANEFKALVALEQLYEVAILCERYFDDQEEFKECTDYISRLPAAHKTRKVFGEIEKILEI